MESYEAYSVLEPLWPLVNKQRQLEAKILPFAPLVDQEKAIRQDINDLLIKAGIAKGDGVTCHGYDVVHVERVGSTRLNQDMLASYLIQFGMPAQEVQEMIAACTETGEPSTWATVKPSKGSKVRLDTPTPAKAALRKKGA